MAKLSEFQTDPAAVREGRRVKWKGPVVLRIARWFNPRHEEAFMRLCQPHVAAIRDRTIEENVMMRISQEAAAEGLLCGWENIDNEDDTGPLEFSVDKAREILTEPKNEDLYRFVLIEAQKDTAYLVNAIEAGRKNSATS